MLFGTEFILISLISLSVNFHKTASRHFENFSFVIFTCRNKNCQYFFSIFLTGKVAKSRHNSVNSELCFTLSFFCFISFFSCMIV